MRGLIIALLAMVFLSADTAHYVPQLLANANHSSNPAPVLWQAARTGNSKARTLLTEYAVTHDKPFWLEKLVGVKHPSAAWALYQYHDTDKREHFLLQLAAEGGVPEAQQTLAMSTENAQEREYWLLQSAQQGYKPAQAAVADWYLLKQQPDKARPWLIKTAQSYPASAYHLGRLLWDDGKKQQGRKLIKQAAGQDNHLAQRLQNVLSEYQQQNANQVKRSVWPSDKACKQRIQMFATSLSSIERAHQLYQQFNADERLKTLPLCVKKPVWLSKNTLNCKSNWKQSDRLGCDITPLAPAVETQDATHAIVVADLGKANVNNGVMFLDLSDNYSVLVHELAHFSGFIDEYPLSSTMATRYCTKSEAPNMVVDGALSYAPLSTLQRWQNADDNLVIAESKTCDAHQQQAYKPASQITFLEHHDSGEIPELYLQLWGQQLNQPKAQRPIYMNLFQSFHYAGNTPEAGKWLKKYQEFNQPPDSPQPVSSALSKP